MDNINNLAFTTLVGTYTDSETTLTVVDGSVFPTPPFEATIAPSNISIINAILNGDVEIVLVTAISTNELTVTRAQGGTSAIALGEWGIFQAATKRIFDQLAQAPEFSMIEFSPITEPETIEEDTYVLYMKASGSTPNRILTTLMKDELDNEIIIATTIV